MSSDERLAELRRFAEKAALHRSPWGDDVRFLLTELDAARAREATLRDALTQLVHAVDAHQAQAWATSDIDTSAARAALAGEDTRG